MLKRRSAIEPTIGHLKSDHRLERNFLRGKSGDSINCPDECGWLQLLQTVEGFCLPHVFQPQVVPEYGWGSDLEEPKQNWGFPAFTFASADQVGMKPSQRKFGWEGYAGTTKILYFNKVCFYFWFFKYIIYMRSKKYVKKLCNWFRIRLSLWKNKMRNQIIRSRHTIL